MLRNRQLRAKKSVLVGALLVGVSLFSDPVSAQFRPNPRGNGVAIVFADPNFRGVSQALRGDTPDLRPFRLNDKVSSIEIPAGETWEACLSAKCACQRHSVALAAEGISRRGVADGRGVGSSLWARGSHAFRCGFQVRSTSRRSRWFASATLPRRAVGPGLSATCGVAGRECRWSKQ